MRGAQAQARAQARARAQAQARAQARARARARAQARTRAQAQASRSRRGRRHWHALRRDGVHRVRQRRGGLSRGALGCAGAPLVLGVGEVHAPRGATVPSAARRFTGELLPVLGGRASDLLLELMRPPPASAHAVAEVRRDQAPVTSRHAETDQDEYVAMGTRARELGIVPDMLRPTCADMDAIQQAGDNVIDVSLRTIARLSGAQAAAPRRPRRRLRRRHRPLERWSFSTAGRCTTTCPPVPMRPAGATPRSSMRTCRGDSPRSTSSCPSSSETARHGPRCPGGPTSSPLSRRVASGEKPRCSASTPPSPPWRGRHGRRFGRWFQRRGGRGGAEGSSAGPGLKDPSKDSSRQAPEPGRNRGPRVGPRIPGHGSAARDSWSICRCDCSCVALVLPRV